MALVGLSQLPRIADFASHTITDNLVGHGYGSCKELRADYPRGVGQAAAVEALKRKHHRPASEPGVYAATSTLDRDRDGLVCERK